MFFIKKSECSTSLVQLNLSNFITANAKDLTFMFSRCDSLIDLNISKSKFDIESYSIITSGMFNRCNPELKEKIKKQYKNLNIN